MKKLISLLLVLCMVLGMSVSVFAEGEAITTEELLVAAVEKGGTVTLGGNIQLKSSLNIKTTVTLDLAGYTLTGPTTDTISVEDSAIVVKGGSLTITGNGSVTSATDSAVCVRDGSVTIENGNFTSTPSHQNKYSFAALKVIRVSGSASATVNGGSFSGVRSFLCQNDNASLTINNGTFVGTTETCCNASTVINGGTFSSNENYRNQADILYYGTHDNNDTTKTSIVVNAGTFTNHNPENVPHFSGNEEFRDCVPETSVVTVSDSIYTVAVATTDDGEEDDTTGGEEGGTGTTTPVLPPVVEEDTTVEEDTYYEEEIEEEDNHTSSSDMDELIEETSKNDTDITIDDVNEETTISKSAMEKAIEEDLDIEFKGDGYTLTLKVEDADFSDFKGSFKPYIDTDAGCTTSMKSELKENGIDHKDVQVIKTEFSGELPGEMELEVTLDKELRGEKVYFYYWNAELKQYELIPHSVKGNKIIVKLSHFSTYIITNEPIVGAIVVEEGVNVTAPIVSVDKANPETGASDFVGVAVAMAVMSVLGGVALSKRK